MRSAAALIAALAVAAGGCGGGEEPAAKDPAPNTVDMKNIKYVPDALTVAAGTTVTWTNSDAVGHTVTKESGPGADFDSGTIVKGKTFKQAFEEPGAVAYVCTIHPNQRGTITVE